MNVCVLCGSDRSAVVQQGARHAPEAVIRRCEACGLVYLTPIPSQDELDSYYGGAYRAEYENPTVEETTPEAVARVQRISNLLSPNKRILEIGCGAGAFIKCVSGRVGEAVGVDPEHGTTLRDASGVFDIIAMFHVLEHVAEPVEFLRSVAELIPDSGRIVVEVPNIDDVLVSTYNVPAYRSFYFQKAHLFYFSANTLTATFAKAGLEVTVTGVQRYDLSNHICWATDGVPGGMGRYPFLAEANKSYASALISAGKSDTLWAVAAKPSRRERTSGRRSRSRQRQPSPSPSRR